MYSDFIFQLCSMDILNFFIEPYKSYSQQQILLEILAAGSGILSVWLIGKRRITGYPTGIVSTVTYVWLLWQWNLMGDMMINIYYTCMSLYGWINWYRYKQADTTVSVIKMTSKDYGPALLVFVVSFVFTLAVYSYRPELDQLLSHDALQSSTNDSFLWYYYVDAITTSVFLIAMWLMAKRKIENWHFWIAGNIISIPLYLWKGYAITSLQYLIFLILAWAGLKKWRNAMVLQSS
jgi:nicotinamide mononucleotide transporter